MKLSNIATSGLLFSIVYATPVELHQREPETEQCIEDALYACFTSSLAQASTYCTNSIVTVSETTKTVTFTPTITVTEAVTETTIQPAQFTSACSCIGVTTTTLVATATASVPATVVETQTATATITDNITRTEVIIVTVTPSPSTLTEITPTETSTTSAATTTTPVARPVLINGDFATGTTEGWSVFKRIGKGDTETVLTVGNAKVLDIYVSYFTSSAAAAVEFGQQLNWYATELSARKIMNHDEG
ncbi:hypothetical protein N0V88_004906 [Collariella sp. IMI 366227]|nr:hypothetical protein N0V88_004906 [Collariella sp. IMI 366227]